MEEQSGNVRLVKVPTEGWCWVRTDQEDRYIRQYWRNGKCFAVISAITGSSVVVSVAWGTDLSKASRNSVSSMAVARQLVDSVAIGIHACIETMGEECVCLNAVPKNASI